MIAMDLSEPVITEAQRAMALKIARGFMRRLPRNVLVEDLEQAAMLGLWDGLQKSAGRSHSHEQSEFYLRTRIRGAIIDELRTQDWLQRRLRREERTGHAHVRLIHGADTSGNLSWEETLAAPEEGQDERLDAARLCAVAQRALRGNARGARELRIVREHYEKGRNFKTIGGELGISEPRVSQLHHRAIRKMRAALTEEEHEPRASDRRSGSPAPEDRAPRAVAGAVPGGGLARPAPAAAARLVPRRARGPELGGAAREELHPARSAAGDAGALAGADGGLAVIEVATEPVPSVLPEAGLKLAEELGRYRDWLVDQALLRASNNIAHAGDLLGLSKSCLNKLLRRRGVSLAPGPRGRYARRSPQPAAQLSAPHTQPPPPPPEPLGEPAAASQPLPTLPPSSTLETERRLAKLAARIPWDRVDELRCQGLGDYNIAKKLADSLDVNRLLLQKALQRQRQAAPIDGRP